MVIFKALFLKIIIDTQCFLFFFPLHTPSRMFLHPGRKKKSHHEEDGCFKALQPFKTIILSQLSSDLNSLHASFARVITEGGVYHGAVWRK